MITIVKQDHNGKEVWRYTGEVLLRTPERVLVAAWFTHSDLDLHGMILRKGDLFLEAYYYKKWYNIFEIYDRDDGHLKGWYCNITRPAHFTRWRISYQDLALDLLVPYCGSAILADEREFQALALPEHDQRSAWQAVDEVRQLLADQRFRLNAQIT